jgi:hypothetical protein
MDNEARRTQLTTKRHRVARLVEQPRRGRQERGQAAVGRERVRRCRVRCRRSSAALSWSRAERSDHSEFAQDLFDGCFPIGTAGRFSAQRADSIRSLASCKTEARFYISNPAGFRLEPILLFHQCLNFLVRSHPLRPQVRIVPNLWHEKTL